MKRHLFGAAALALITGCGGSVISAPRVGTPVLLGPVDRVGGHRARVAHGESFDAKGESSLFVANAAGGLYTSSFRTPIVAGSWAILDQNVTAADDVHIRAATLRGFVMNAFGVFWMDNKVVLNLAIARKGSAR